MSFKHASSLNCAHVEPGAGTWRCRRTCILQYIAYSGILHIVVTYFPDSAELRKADSVEGGEPDQILIITFPGQLL